MISGRVRRFAEGERIAAGSRGDGPATAGLEAAATVGEVLAELGVAGAVGGENDDGGL